MMYAAENTDVTSSMDVLNVKRTCCVVTNKINQQLPLKIDNKLNTKLIVFLLLFAIIKYTKTSLLQTLNAVAKYSIISTVPFIANISEV